MLALWPYAARGTPHVAEVRGPTRRPVFITSLPNPRLDVHARGLVPVSWCQTGANNCSACGVPRPTRSASRAISAASSARDPSAPLQCSFPVLVVVRPTFALLPFSPNTPTLVSLTPHALRLTCSSPVRIRTPPLLIKAARRRLRTQQADGVLDGLRELPAHSPPRRWWGVLGASGEYATVIQRTWRGVSY